MNFRILEQKIKKNDPTHLNIPKEVARLHQMIDQIDYRVKKAENFSLLNKLRDPNLKTLALRQKRLQLIVNGLKELQGTENQKLMGQLDDFDYKKEEVRSLDSDSPKAVTEEQKELLSKYEAILQIKKGQTDKASDKSQSYFDMIEAKKREALACKRGVTTADKNAMLNFQAKFKGPWHDYFQPVLTGGMVLNRPQIQAEDAPTTN